MSKTSPPGLVTREQLLSQTKRRFDNVAIPHLGTVRLRSLTERERTAYEAASLNETGEQERELLIDSKRRLIALCVVDADGNPLLTDGDVDALADIDGSITGRLYAACLDHCGFTKGDIEGLVKNSPPATDDASS